MGLDSVGHAPSSFVGDWCKKSTDREVVDR